MASDDRPLTSAEALYARIVLQFGDSKMRDIELALDLVDRFLRSLELEPGQKIADYENRRVAPVLH